MRLVNDNADSCGLAVVSYKTWNWQNDGNNNARGIFNQVEARSRPRPCTTPFDENMMSYTILYVDPTETLTIQASKNRLLILIKQ